MQPDWEICLDTNISPVIAKWMSDFTGYTVKSSYSLSFQKTDDLILKIKDFLTTSGQ
jgi:hypothetical protein